MRIIRGLLTTAGFDGIARCTGPDYMGVIILTAVFYGCLNELYEHKSFNLLSRWHDKIHQYCTYEYGFIKSYSYINLKANIAKIIVDGVYGFTDNGVLKDLNCKNSYLRYFGSMCCYFSGINSYKIVHNKISYCAYNKIDRLIAMYWAIESASPLTEKIAD